MKKVIVTGANGFVGYGLIKELVANDVEVYAVLRHEDGDVSRLEELSGVKIIYCDLEHIHSLDTMIDTRGFDVFYHFAWAGSAGPLRGDVAVQLDNVKFTCDAVRVSASLQCAKFVIASSIMEIECIDIMKTTLKPGFGNIYATGKLAAHYMARVVATDLAVDFIAATISNIYGVGELSPRLINTSIQKLQKGERASFSPGEQMYDFIYIDDAAKAFYAIGEKGKASKNYYIGTREPKPLKVFLEEMRDCVSPSAELGLGDFEFNGVSLNYDEIPIYQLYEDTGFMPEVSFTQGIQLTATWIKEINKGKEIK